jgi:signal transduction histidine kinase
MLNNIYKAFYTTKGIGGTGLGLWISSGIVERHKGRLIVRSAREGAHSGTVFQLFLPWGAN